MEFVIYKSSDIYGIKQPCENAFVKKGIDTIDRWAIKIDTLEELLDLNKKLKQPLIVSRVENHNVIEIYDDYRE